METLQLLATALGLSALSGINLYLTVFATSVALNAGWLQLSADMAGLQVLSDPSIMVIAGFMYFLEFFADKVPGIDSIWDGIHTAVRPIGAMFLATRVLGQTDPAIEVIAVLLCGGMAFATHAAKAGTRILINASPEPFSNSAVSLAEDVAVAGGLGLIYSHPLAGFGLVILCTALIAYLAPRVWRNLKAGLGLGISRLLPKKEYGEGRLPVILHDWCAESIRGSLEGGRILQWSITGLSGNMPAGTGLPACLSAIGREGQATEKLLFLLRKGRNKVLTTELSPSDISVSLKRGMFYNEIVLTDVKRAEEARLRLSRREDRLVDLLMDELS